MVCMSNNEMDQGQESVYLSVYPSFMFGFCRFVYPITIHWVVNSAIDGKTESWTLKLLPAPDPFHF